MVIIGRVDILSGRSMLGGLICVAHGKVFRAVISHNISVWRFLAPALRHSKIFFLQALSLKQATGRAV